MTDEEMRELPARMLTCAAYLLKPQQVDRATRDAAELLRLGAEALEQFMSATRPSPELLKLGAEALELGEPMEILTSAPASPTGFTDPDPTASRAPDRSSPSKVCPSCGSRAAKKVVRVGRDLVAQCPACGEQWQLKFEAQWGAR